MPADFLHPLVLGPRAEFSQLQLSLLSSGYNEKNICQRSGIESIFYFEVHQEHAYKPSSFRDRLDLLLRVLMHGQVARERDLLALLEPGELDVFESLGVLARSPGDESLLYATAALYPVENVYVVSDRPYSPLPGWSTPVPADVVFAAITRHTRVFLGSIPRDPCENLLDLCAGSGIAALLAGANFADKACAADLGERCVHFSEFSRRLNHLDNVRTAVGDLYAAVPRQLFDRIVAHPPYIPNKETSLLFRDGGADGEQIFRGIIEGLPAALAPGGRLHCVTFASDRTSGELEDRVRAWLGAEEADFDIILAASELRSRPDATLNKLAKSGQKLKLGDTGEALEKLGVTRLFYGSVMVQRKPATRSAFSARTLRSPRTTLSAAEDFRRLATALYEPELAEHFNDLIPRLAAEFELIVTHRPGPDGLLPQQYALRLTHPWIADAHTEPWIAILLSLCDGKCSIGDIHQRLRLDDVMSADADPTEFWELIRLLSLSGYLELSK